MTPGQSTQQDGRQILDRERNGQFVGDTVPDRTIRIYCTRCGAQLLDGVCSRDASHIIPTPITERGPDLRPPRLSRGWVTWTLAGLLFVLIATMIFAGRSALDDRDAAIASLEGEMRSLADKTDDLSATVGSLVERLAAAEGLLDEPDTAALARKAKRSIFTVRATTSSRVGLGSAFVISSTGGGSELITNFHVIEDVWSLGRTDVEILKGNASYAGTIVRTNADEDLAVIRVTERFVRLPVAEGKPAVGDPVIVIGSPYGLQGSVVDGVISAYRGEFLQLSAPVSPGDSGAPVIDMRGRVVAVVVSKIVDEAAEGVSFAIPISAVCGKLASC